MTKNDGEVGSLIWMTAILGLTLLGVDLFYSTWHTMPEFFKIVGYILNGVCVALGVLIFAEWKDPNFDKYRKIFCVVAVAAILLVAGFRAGSNENKMFQQDVDKSKQEQTK